MMMFIQLDLRTLHSPGPGSLLKLVSGDLNKYYPKRCSSRWTLYVIGVVLRSGICLEKCDGSLTSEV